MFRSFFILVLHSYHVFLSFHFLSNQIFLSVLFLSLHYYHMFLAFLVLPYTFIIYFSSCPLSLPTFLSWCFFLSSFFPYILIKCFCLYISFPIIIRLLLSSFFPCILLNMFLSVLFLSLPFLSYVSSCPLPFPTFLSYVCFFLYLSFPTFSINFLPTHKLNNKQKKAIGTI
jgi:hypothetical protein